MKIETLPLQQQCPWLVPAFGTRSSLFWWAAGVCIRDQIFPLLVGRADQEKHDDLRLDGPADPLGRQRGVCHVRHGENVLNPVVVVEALSGLPDKSNNSASWRWAVCAREAGELELQLQCLPCPTTILAGKPIFKR